jgi:hypothetical protein
LACDEGAGPLARPLQRPSAVNESSATTITRHQREYLLILVHLTA